MPDETKTPQDAKTDAAVESEAQATDAAKKKKADAAETDAEPAAETAADTASEADEPASKSADPEPEGVAVKLDKFDASEAPKKSAEPAPAAPAAPEADSADPVDAQIEQLKTDLAAKEDQLLRAVADVQNARRRAERDRKDAEVYGGRKLARDLLSVYDNIESALQYASDSLKENEPDFFKGVELTRNGLIDAFAKHQISPIQPEVGDKFDPNLHQAMYEAPAPGAEPGTVIQVMQHGFKMAEQLLRPAMVGVAKAEAGAAPSKPKNAPGGEGADEKAASA